MEAVKWLLVYVHLFWRLPNCVARCADLDQNKLVTRWSLPWRCFMPVFMNNGSPHSKDAYAWGECTVLFILHVLPCTSTWNWLNKSILKRRFLEVQTWWIYKGQESFKFSYSGEIKQIKVEIAAACDNACSNSISLSNFTPTDYKTVKFFEIPVSTLKVRHQNWNQGLWGSGK